MTILLQYNLPVWRSSSGATAGSGTMQFVRSDRIPGKSGIGEYARGIGVQILQQRAGLALKAAKIEADLANRAKTEFLANMSHELRTPLNAIIGFAQILSDPTLIGGDEEKQIEYANYIGDSAQHLLSIINNILDISKIEHHRMDLHLELVDVEPLIDSCLILVRDRCHQAGIELQKDYCSSELPIYADSVKFKQIVVNLLTNAVKFIRPGGRILVSTRMIGTTKLIVSIRDTGIGMSPEDMRHALEPFGQVATNYSRSGEGTGLGLPLTKALAELHGAEFNLTSRIGVGTEVSVTFALTEAGPVK